ncbi:hypothetical protein K474DRAFT_1614902 [Panus rudis PR-1116 ss-1]|nr:hypothetical protein K474DRAFT_1614902 [Panus rudis PR-1116 ss-1]
MNLHDQSHKRTSIDQLLNPVASGPSSHLDPRSVYASNQLPNLANSVAYLPASHQQHVSPPSSYPPNIHQAGTFRLSAASWDARAVEERMPNRHPDLDSSSSCRYTAAPGPSSAQASHAVYSEPHYHRQPQRNGDAEPSTSYQPVNVSSWPQPQETPNISYNHAPVTPMYSDERTGASVSNDNIPKPYAPPQYDQPQEYLPQYAANGYFPVIMTNPNCVALTSSCAVWQPAERASVRLAARGSMNNGHPGLPPVQHRGQPSPHAYYPQVAFVAVPIQQPPMPPPKRALEEVPEEEPAPKKKSRAKKATGDGSASTSRRGYSAKKRNEAAQIAAQNAMGAMVSFSQSSSDQGKDFTVVVGAEGKHTLQPELQFARCMSNRYRSEEFPRCVSCTRRWAGDTCRFQGIRFFLKDENRNIVGISFVENQKPDGPSMNFPLQWNIPLTEVHIRRVKRTVARSLLPILKAEREHIAKPEIIRRPRESEVRATCDTCMTSIFSCSWMCRLCGREACAECFEQVRELTTDRVGANEAEIAALQARRDKHAHINPFFLSCTRRNEHRARDFSPMSRFSREELTQAITDMEALLAQPDEDALPDSEKVEQSDSPTPPLGFSSNNENTSENGTVNPVNGAHSSAPSANGASSSGVHANPEPDRPADSHTVNGVNGATCNSVPSYETSVFEDAELTDDVFRRVWIKGEPLVVRGLLHKFQLQWTPDYFRTKYGAQSCLILECQSDQNKRVTVGEFFSWFGQYEGRRDCWKLKDWPPSTDFKTAFPELYEDFSRATPVPNYVRRDGVLNIASHFPSNTVAPDLGPKMYNAMASFESAGSKGSTRLHMDMADAVNIMLYAAATPQGQPGSAVWDVYRAEDAPKLRKFLKKRFKGMYQHDPIHSQQFYLDADLRRDLYNEHGVKSHRIYQRPGEAVLIPAGCAHQVCNLADSIKVACDFVSPENIDRCENLTREFREQNQSMAWKEDVLQLRTMMWFAWLSATRQEKELQGHD